MDLSLSLRDDTGNKMRKVSDFLSSRPSRERTN